MDDLSFFHGLLQGGVVNALNCRGAGRSYLIASLTIVAVVVALCVALKLFWNRRLVNYRTSLLVPLVIAFVLSTVLVAWNPLKTEIFLDCVEHPQFSRFVFLGDIAPVARGLVLGGLVSAAFYLFTVFVVGLSGRLRKS